MYLNVNDSSQLAVLALQIKTVGHRHFLFFLKFASLSNVYLSPLPYKHFSTSELICIMFKRKKQTFLVIKTRKITETCLYLVNDFDEIIKSFNSDHLRFLNVDICINISFKRLAVANNYNLNLRKKSSWTTCRYFNRSLMRKIAIVLNTLAQTKAAEYAENLNTIINVNKPFPK